MPSTDADPLVPAEPRATASGGFDLTHLLALLGEHLPALIAYIDRDQRYRYNSRAYERLLGRPLAEITGRRVCDVFDPPTWRRLAPRLHAALHGEQVNFDYSVTRDGESRRMQASLHPHIDHGVVQGVLVLATDISERHATEQRLRESEAAHRLLIALQDGARDIGNAAAATAALARPIALHFGADRCVLVEVECGGRWAVVLSAHVVDGPPAASRYRIDDFGEAAAATLRAGQTVAIGDVQTDPRTAAVDTLAAFAALGARAVLALPVVRHGRLAAALVLSRAAPHDWSRSEISLAAQIAERMWSALEAARIDVELRESRDVLALAMRSGRMGAWSRDLASGAVWWSAELEEIFGLPTGSFRGSEADFLALVHPDDRDAVATAVQHALRVRSDYRIEFRFRHASGEWRWMEGCGRLVHESAGEPRMLYGLGIDITERRRNEQALRAADRRKDEFLATLAHELRNPLAPITHAVAIMRHAGTPDPRSAAARDVIERQVRHLARLVDDLLDVSRIARDKVTLRRAPVELASVIEAAVELARPFIDVAGHRLELQLPAEPVRLDADAARLTQIVSNLLNNAAKFTPPDGRIEVVVEVQREHALIRVRDSGIGIAADHLPQVFEMFSQAAPALERSAGGLGIGLALVRGLVELHGGTVSAASDGPGHGSEFTVRLPRLASCGEPPRAPNRIAEGLGHRALRILVVDDNVDAAGSLGMLLELLGHEVSIAHDGEHGLQLAEQWQPTLALVDIGLPGINGYEMARRIRAAGWGQRMRLVAVTGWGQQRDRERALAAGFDRHLTKPVEVEVLKGLLGEVACG